MKKAILSIQFYDKEGHVINTEVYENYYIPNTGDAVNNPKESATTYYVTQKEYYFDNELERCHVIIYAKAKF